VFLFYLIIPLRVLLTQKQAISISLPGRKPTPEPLSYRKFTWIFALNLNREYLIKGIVSQKDISNSVDLKTTHTYRGFIFELTMSIVRPLTDYKQSL
jgi:hypothetical protein